MTITKEQLLNIIPEDLDLNRTPLFFFLNIVGIKLIWFPLRDQRPKPTHGTDRIRASQRVRQVRHLSLLFCSASVDVFISEVQR